MTTPVAPVARAAPDSSVAASAVAAHSDVPPTRGYVTALMFAATALTWGSSYLMMKYALVGISAGQVAVGRILLGALTLIAIMTITRRPWPRSRALWGHLTVVGIFQGIVPFSLFAWAGHYLPTGLSAILNGATPMFTALFTAIAVPAAALRGRQWFGIGLGAIGVMIVMGLWGVITDPAFGDSLVAQLAVIGATISYGVGFTYLRRMVTGRYRCDAVTLASVQVTMGAVAALAVSPVIAWGPMNLTPSVVASMLVLGCIGTGVAFTWNMRVVMTWGPVAASTVTYLQPVVGVGLGMLVLGETFAWYQGLGAVVVIAGVFLTQRPVRVR
ncbi:DMT family transporter [Serinibacter salmoneus]|uniref:DMT family transporter n=1 Tax=Serinibacter salmoneus TaxID=556530 RepID=UPI000BF318E9|nr:DMT family transporter [Serinibacter salmoneus]